MNQGLSNVSKVIINNLNLKIKELAEAEIEYKKEILSLKEELEKAKISQSAGEFSSDIIVDGKVSYKDFLRISKFHYLKYFKGPTNSKYMVYLDGELQKVYFKEKKFKQEEYSKQLTIDRILQVQKEAKLNEIYWILEKAKKSNKTLEIEYEYSKSYSYKKGKKVNIIEIIPCTVESDYVKAFVVGSTRNHPHPRFKLERIKSIHII